MSACRVWAWVQIGVATQADLGRHLSVVAESKGLKPLALSDGSSLGLRVLAHHCSAGERCFDDVCSRPLNLAHIVHSVVTSDQVNIHTAAQAGTPCSPTHRDAQRVLVDDIPRHFCEVATEGDRG